MHKSGKIVEMKILVTIDWFYPAFRAGGPITSMRNFIENLASEHQFYILTSNKDFGNVKLDVNVNKWIELKPNIKVFYANSLKQVIKQLKSSKFDILIINGIYSFRYSILPNLLFRNKRIIFPRGMLSSHSLAVKSIKKRTFLAVAKAVNLYKNASFWTNSKDEYNEILSHFKSQNIELIPNFVDKTICKQKISKTPGQLKLITIARISPVKNLEFAIQVFQTGFKGTIVWDIFGPIESQQYFQKLKQLALKLPENVKLNFKNEISPYDIKRIISEYHFFYLPTLGENFGHSIFEAFASSRPVIISNKTPWKNLEKLNAGWDLELNIVKFRQILNKALSLNQKEFDQMCQNSQKIALDFIKKQQKQIAKVKSLLLTS